MSEYTHDKSKNSLKKSKIETEINSVTATQRSQKVRNRHFTAHQK
jgi:hypothetical protein